MITEDEINQAYNNLRATLENYYNAQELATKEKRDLDNMCLEVLFDGTVTGRNEDERKANLRKFYPVEFKNVEELQAKTRLARFRFDLAENEVKRIEALITLSKS